MAGIQPGDPVDASRLAPDLAKGRRFLAAHPPPGRALLVAVTGAHLYGFPSVDSDLDLKGIHLAPTRAVLGLSPTDAAHDRLAIFEGLECDLTTQEVARAARLLLQGNGNLLEQVTSPYQLVDDPAVAALRDLLPSILSRRCHGHYRGYLKGMRREHAKNRRIKSLLYAYRVALTGLHLLETGTVEAHLPTLLDAHGVSGPDESPLADLILRKQRAEKGVLDDAAAEAHDGALDALALRLDDALSASVLPIAPPNPAALEDWVVTLRLGAL
jgi:predicted nucleotidyltransferase